MVTRTATSPVLQFRRLKLRMEETHVQGHSGPGVEPGFIAGVIDTKAQLSGHLSPLLCPAQGPPDRARRPLRGTFQAGILLRSTLLCHIALHLRATESQHPPRLGLWGPARPTPGNQHVNWGPGWHRTHPRSRSKSQQSQPLNPGSLLKPRAASLDLLRSTGDSAPLTVLMEILRH